MRASSLDIGLLLSGFAFYACAAGGADPAFWAPGGALTPVGDGCGGGTGGASGSTSSNGGAGPSTTSGTSSGPTTSGPSTSSGPSTTSSGPSTTSSTSSGPSTTSSTSSGPSTTSSSTTSGGGAITWTYLYTNLFGPTGPADCTSNGGCHTNTQSGFKCGTTATECYDGLVNAGYVVAGGPASAEPILQPSSTCLNGVLGYNMPKNGYKITAADVANMTSWANAGAQDD
jgi:hypothetical protein